MFSFDRHNGELAIIEKAPYVPAGKLAHDFGVTERTIRNDIASMNGVLEHHGARINLERGRGYHLVIEDEGMFSQFKAEQGVSDGAANLSTSASRLRAIIAALLDADDYLSTTDVSSIAFVSKSTAQAYIRDARTAFERHGLECVQNMGRGVRLFGSEQAKRTCYMAEVIMPDKAGFINALKQNRGNNPPPRFFAA